MEIGQEMAMEIGGDDQNYRRDNYRQNSNQRYRNRISSEDHGRSRSRHRIDSQNNLNSRNRYGNDRNQVRNRNRSNSSGRKNSLTRSRSSSCVRTNRDRLRCYRCSEYNHFARKCPNALTDEISDEIDDATLQMLTQDETSPLDIGFEEDLNMCKARMMLSHFCQIQIRRV